MQHKLITHKRHRGQNTHAGTDARCSCQSWDWYTNEYPPSRGGDRDARKAHHEHRASMTPEQEIELGGKHLAKAQERLAKAVADEWASGIKLYADSIARIASELAADIDKLTNP